VSDEFHKFPHTLHLLWLGASSLHDNKLLKPPEAREFLLDDLIVQKIDGAELVLSLGSDGQIRAQSRGRFLAPDTPMLNGNCFGCG
jgi:hypothetical protein